MRREINIQRMQLTLPLNRTPRKRDGKELAETVAAGLAGLLQQTHAVDAGGSLATVRVRVPAKQANAKGMATAIYVSISQETATKRREQ